MKNFVMILPFVNVDGEPFVVTDDDRYDSREKAFSRFEARHAERIKGHLDAGCKMGKMVVIQVEAFVSVSVFGL